MWQGVGSGSCRGAIQVWLVLRDRNLVLEGFATTEVRDETGLGTGSEPLDSVEGGQREVGEGLGIWFSPMLRPTGPLTTSDIQWVRSPPKGSDGIPNSMVFGLVQEVEVWDGKLEAKWPVVVVLAVPEQSPTDLGGFRCGRDLELGGVGQLSKYKSPKVLGGGCWFMIGPVVVGGVVFMLMVEDDWGGGYWFRIGPVVVGDVDCMLMVDDRGGGGEPCEMGGMGEGGKRSGGMEVVSNGRGSFLAILRYAKLTKILMVGEGANPFLPPEV